MQNKRLILSNRQHKGITMEIAGEIEDGTSGFVAARRLSLFQRVGWDGEDMWPNHYLALHLSSPTTRTAEKPNLLNLRKTQLPRKPKKCLYWLDRPGAGSISSLHILLYRAVYAAAVDVL